MSEIAILVVDDDIQIRRMLRRCLEGEGFAVSEAADAAGVEREMDAEHFDLVTLDLALGRDNGFAVARAIRQKSEVPIVMVTGKGDVIDRVAGLEVGADDYITKPFHLREVVARLRAVLRRTKKVESQHARPDTPDRGPEDGCYCFDGLRVSVERFELIDRDGALGDLTSGEFRLLKMFLDNQGKILSRERIMDLLHGHEWTPLDRTIDNQVARLRKKIERDAANPRLIKTVRGVGYSFAVDIESC